MRVEVSRREQALELRRAKLARLCGLDGQSIECKMEFETVHRPHSADRIKSSLDNHPRMRAARQALRRAEARILLATAERIPDLEVRLGVERDRLEEETTGLAALAMPLPVFDRLEGAIAAARSLRDQAEAGGRQTVSMLRDEIVPAHHAAAKATVTAYQLGQADLTALQQARRRVLETEDELNGALSDWHRAWIDLEHAAGTSLPTP